MKKNLESCPSWPKEHDWKSCNRSKPVRGFESLALRQNEKQVARPAFCFGKTKRGIRTRREQTQSAEENSPVDCFCRRGQGAKRREGARECAEKIPCSPPKRKAGCKACFLLWQNKKRDSNKEGADTVCGRKQSGGLFLPTWSRREATRRCTGVRRKNPLLSAKSQP